VDNDRNAPATRGDIQDAIEAMDNRFEGKLDAAEQRLEGKLDAAEQRILDKVATMIRDAETRLLEAFYTFAESNQKRLGESEREVAGLKERLGILEARMTGVEKRLNMPPQT
jgi:hypothetical protein